MSSRTSQDPLKALFTSWEPYNLWAPAYEKDMSLMQYQAHEHAVSTLMQHFTGDPSQTTVLDVACGSGLVAKKMVELGFRNFVGVDASEGMLKEAHLSGLYQALHHTELGKQPLSVEKESFDVVAVVGALSPGFIPVSAVREVCDAAKPAPLRRVALGATNHNLCVACAVPGHPKVTALLIAGGLVCLSKEHYLCPEYISYDAALEKELTKMESEVLWTRLTATKAQRFIVNTQTDEEDPDKRGYISGTVYVFRKSSYAYICGSGKKN